MRRASRFSAIMCASYRYWCGRHPDPVTWLLSILVVAVALWTALVLTIERLLVPWLARFCGHDPLLGLARLTVLVYCRLLHRVEVTGAEDLRETIDPGRLLVVMNHTAGIDPLLLQCRCRFYIRWMMAEDMMVPAVADVLRWLQVIPVRRAEGDSSALRAAIRHLQADGVIGVFPEGGITRPTGRIGPFMAGVGMIAAKTRAPVLLVWVSGTPRTRTAFGSLVWPSRTRVRCELQPPFPASMGAAEITTAMRTRLSEMSGWPCVDAAEPKPSEQDESADGRNLDAPPGRWP